MVAPSVANEPQPLRADAAVVYWPRMCLYCRWCAVLCCAVCRAMCLACSLVALSVGSDVTMF